LSGPGIWSNTNDPCRNFQLISRIGANVELRGSDECLTFQAVINNETLQAQDLIMKKTIPVIVVLTLLGGLSAWYFYSGQEPQTHPSVLIAPPEVASEPAADARYPLQPPEVETAELAEPLPDLEHSDESVIEALSELIGQEALGSHFILEQVINRVVATIDSLDSAQVAPLVLPVKPLPDKFLVTGGEVPAISPHNSARYQPLVELLMDADAASGIAVYRRFYPLFQQSYVSLGHEGGYFNDRLVEIVDHLLMTPILSADPELVKVEAQYHFAQESLQSLSAGQ